MASFEALCRVMSSSINLLFLKSGRSVLKKFKKLLPLHFFSICLDIIPMCVHQIPVKNHITKACQGLSIERKATHHLDTNYPKIFHNVIIQVEN